MNVTVEPLSRHSQSINLSFSPAAKGEQRGTEIGKRKQRLL